MFSPALFSSVNPPSHPNQIPSPLPHWPHFLYHIEHKTILFTPRNVLSMLETFPISTGTKLNSCVLPGKLQQLFNWCLPPAPKYYIFSNSNLIISVVILKSLMIVQRIKFKCQTLTGFSFTKPLLRLHWRHSPHTCPCLLSGLCIDRSLLCNARPLLLSLWMANSHLSFKTWLKCHFLFVTLAHISQFLVPSFTWL